MSSPGESSGPVAVGGLSFEPTSGELAGPSGVTRLAPQPADLLGFLLERAGQVVSRDEIKGRLWPHGRVDFEQGIAFAVSEIRRGFDAAGGDPGVLETIPRRGFRLNLDRDGPAADQAPSDRSASPAGNGGSGRTATFPRLLFGLGSFAAAALVLFMSLRGTDPAPEPILAIFAYDDTGGGAVDLFSASLTEALTTALTLSYRGRLGVIGPTGTASIPGPDDTDAARDALGACLVLSGSVRPVGDDSAVVFTQIVRTSDRVHVWAERDTVPLSEGADSVLTDVIAGLGASLIGCS